MQCFEVEAVTDRPYTLGYALRSAGRCGHRPLRCSGNSFEVRDARDGVPYDCLESFH
ncbi:MAG: hypothetical protein FWE47_02245 [Oscillospiraceae bacterium]|nr:hypothetical protein [Oscillospiraceae bacterium]